MKFKNLLISSLILMGAISIHSSAFAQSSGAEEAIVKFPANRLTTKLQSNLNSHARFRQPQKNTTILQKTDVINSRLHALSIYGHDGVMFNPSDSIRFFWGEANHDPNLAMFILNALLYYPNNTPEVPEAYEQYDLKVDSASNYGWNPELDDYQLYMKTIIALDDQGNIISETGMETYDGISWENSDRTVYTYDTQGNKISETNQQWSVTVWENYSKQEFAYDSQNNITEVIEYDWENGSSSWKENERRIIGYESSNNINSLIEQNWNSMENSWENYSRTSILYVGTNVTQMVYDYWDDAESQWVSDEKTVYTYNADNQLTETEISEWDDVNEQWESWEKMIYNYDDLGNNTSLIAQYLENGSWQYDYKEEYTYSSLDLTKVTALEWNGSQFAQFARILYSYNDYGQCTQAHTEFWGVDDWATMMYSLKLKFYYEEFEDGITGIETISDRAKFEIYPNPAADFLKVKLDNNEIQHIRIVDVTGKTVFESRAGFNASEVSIPVNQFHNGVYILQLTSGNQTGTKSFVVSH